MVNQVTAMLRKQRGSITIAWLLCMDMESIFQLAWTALVTDILAKFSSLFP